jgi:hypothetical protein
MERMSTRRARGENCSDGWGPCALVDGRPDSVSPLSQGSNGPRKSLSTLKMALLKPSRGREKGGGDAASVGMTGGWSGLLGSLILDRVRGTPASQTRPLPRKERLGSLGLFANHQARVGISKAWNDEAWM